MKRFLKTAVFLVLPFMLLGCTPDTETEAIDHSMNEQVKTDDGLTVTVTNTMCEERRGFDYLLVCLHITSNKPMGNVEIKSPPYQYNFKHTKQSSAMLPDYISNSPILAPNESADIEIGLRVENVVKTNDHFIFRFFKTSEGTFFNDSFKRTWVLENPLKS